MRAVRSCKPRTVPAVRFAAPRSTFHTSRRREQSSFHRRYGPAVEPKVPPPNRPGGKDEKFQELSGEKQSGASAAEESDLAPEQPRDEGESPAAEEDEPGAPASGPMDATSSSLSEQAAADTTKPSSSSAEPQQAQDPPDQSREDITNKDLSTDEASTSSSGVGEEMSQMAPYAHTSAFDEVYHMPSPSTSLAPAEPSPQNKAPHMSPARYVHHFDTYSLVLDLSKGGYTNEQSITIMKAVRTILQNNIDFARESLTSKSDVENETYLFKAACSELTQSLQSARNGEIQRQRTSRAHLQHEIDILSQRLNQELQGMKDDIKGMFNDHKMATRENQRVIDTMVQELNYKITVSLNSDSKSEIEGLRWILTRRAALTVGICACKSTQSFLNSAC